MKVVEKRRDAIGNSCGREDGESDIVVQEMKCRGGGKDYEWLGANPSASHNIISKLFLDAMLIVGLGGALRTTLRPLILVLLELPPHVDPPNVLAVGLPTFVGLDMPLSIPLDDEGEPTPKHPYSEEL